MNSGRLRILVVGDAVAPTGFATVTHNLCQRLLGDFEIHHLGINHSGDPHGLPWAVYPAWPGGDVMGVRRLRPLVEALRPRLVFLVNDPWVVGDYMDQIRDFLPELKVVLYCPVDAGPLEGFHVERMAGAHRLVAYTEFGRRELERAGARVRAERPGFELPPVEVIPHGVDSGRFFPQGGEGLDPRERRARAIRALLGSGARGDELIVLNGNRNQPRKRIDITIKGFSLFAENKPASVRLHLHMGMEDAGWNVPVLAERHGISDRLVVSSMQHHPQSVSHADLNTIYNAAAVGLNTSTGEGWGLVSFEHASTGAAQIVPRHSACEELWEGSALLVEPVLDLTMEGILADARIVSPEGIAEALERLYEDRDLLEAMAQAAFQNATRPEYRWSAIAERWRDLFRSALDATDPLSDAQSERRGIA